MLTMVAISNDWQVEYDIERRMYRVSYFQDNHFVDDCWFDEYDGSEIKKCKEK